MADRVASHKYSVIAVAANSRAHTTRMMPRRRASVMALRCAFLLPGLVGTYVGNNQRSGVVAALDEPL